ncbi:MAG: 5'-nucleotidase C-terminal domain-containing protein [Hymenobacteraceae bacterium]|nr:5'-nucleotidase C-terminal domain-containing protein [Hymenobacteraceae bacterium]MDX5394980.1 5'-nucleotidase C-terminal domain-containing protein [Hymenobacteraceae bacterium]MDX5443220.1 5'-nucleotidase C-terminal domain-containing protein [Hymenobacteraceae bacterium]MDX5511013.1 5'-nucleotidase C-terminal domain-containing protein [Hymenobacteraceae bacterium]
MTDLRFRVLTGIIFLGSAAVLGSCQRTWQATPKVADTAIVLDSTFTPDAAAQATIAPYRTQVEAQMNEVIGVAPVALDKGPVESPLGNFITQLLLKRAEIAYGRQIDVAVTTNGGLRTPIPQGNIKVGDIFELMPFENELVVLTVRGETLQKLFEYAAKRETAPIAGATYTLDKGIATDIKINGEPLQPNQTYTLVTSDYLANGGDNMGFLKEAEKYEQLGIMFRDAILNHIKALTAAGKPVEAPAKNRVTVK